MPSWAKWAVSLLVALALISIGWRYTPILMTLHVLVCFVLVIVIMLQSGNAADLAGAFGGAGSQTAFGPRGAANFLSRATEWCAIMFMATSMVLVLRQGDLAGSFGSIFERMGSKPAPTQPAPATSTPIPVQVPVPGTQQPGQPAQNPFTTPQQGQPAPQQTPAQTPPAQQAPAQQNPAPQQPPAKKP